MRIVFDISGATEMSGGMRLHATEIVRAWATRYPEDHITVFGTRWAADEFRDLHQVRVLKWSNEGIPLRFFGQIFVAPSVRRLLKADFLVSLSPIVSPLTAKRRGVCFQHDWRHIKNPDEFSKAKKVYRKLWTLSASRALVNACISEKTRDETLTIVPGSRTILVSNGGDHPSRWNTVMEKEAEDLAGSIVTFGHHNNKRPHLVIEGFARFLASNPESKAQLVVLGARGSLQERLESLASGLGITSRVVFPGFVSDTQYQNIVAQAVCIVLASSDEGYGLPMAEADYFGLPAIATSDSGLDSIFNNLIVAEPTSSGLEIAIKQALTVDTTSRAKTLPSWQDSASVLRRFLSTVALAH
ncbi:glycosyltransferase [Arthrobacter sp. zg-Y238]|uniref:glycosyltransferase n=1 Tax=Arthrobacter sp. zg-Y238 TaxID=2964614 RepID=UPI002102BCF8|nr:glycosyltransferase [Arthrobacter sp. zg-Y238]MCQ1954393.1 glycosyltransferase [Arthrobacter sp. zg-Y238]